MTKHLTLISFTETTRPRTIGCHLQEQTDLKTHFIICFAKLSMSALE